MNAGDRAEDLRAATFIRRAVVVAGCGVLTVAATACESTEQESAKLAREDQQTVAGPGKLKLGARNSAVRVTQVTLLSSGGRTAVAAKLTSTARGAQADVPVLVDVTGRGGKMLYSNEAGGIERSLQEVGVLRPGQGEWWVDDQVLTSTTPTAARVTVGTGRSVSSHAIPEISTGSVTLSQRAGATVVSGEVVNHSSKAERGVPVYAVALRDGRVTAAGRAVIEALPGAPMTPVQFEIFLVGSTVGATLELTPSPTLG